MEFTEWIWTNLDKIYFICAGPLFLLIAIYGLRQLKISKYGHDLAEKRASLKTADERIREFIDHLLPQIEQVRTKMKNSDIKFYESVSFTRENDQYHLEIADDYKLEDINNVLFDEIHACINNVYQWSLAFTTEPIPLADPQHGCMAAGADYCHFVELVIPLIFAADKMNTFSSMITLYEYWHDILEQQENFIELAKMKERLKELTNS